MLTDHYPLRLLVTKRYRITADAYCLLVCALQILLLTYLLTYLSLMFTRIFVYSANVTL